MTQPGNDQSPTATFCRISGADSPLLSLVVATVDRREDLRTLLQSVWQSCASFGNLSDLEVIVVDQNTDDRNDAAVHEFQDRFRLLHLRQTERNASRARNLGASLARGTWLGFPDDDCRFMPDTLQQIRRYLVTEGGRSSVIAGMTRDDAGHPSALYWSHHEVVINGQNLRTTVAESTVYMRRVLFEAVGGFDPIFGPGGRFAAEEGVDLIRRIWNAAPGTRMLFTPRICLLHGTFCPYKDEDALKRTRAYACARGACFVRHWRTSSWMRLASEVTRHLAGSLIFSGLRRRSRIYSLFGYIEGFIAYRHWQVETPVETLIVATELAASEPVTQ